MKLWLELKNISPFVCLFVYAYNVHEKLRYWEFTGQAGVVLFCLGGNSVFAGYGCYMQYKIVLVSSFRTQITSY